MFTIKYGIDASSRDTDTLLAPSPEKVVKRQLFHPKDQIFDAFYRRGQQKRTRKNKFNIPDGYLSLWK